MMMRKLALAAGVLAWTVSAAAGSLVPDPTVFCPPAAPGIVVDAVLDEITWQIPALVSKFVGVGGEDPQEQTEAWAAFGKDGIYFAFSCRQAKMSPANSPANTQPWRDDSVEVFLDTNGDRATYHHFILSAAGAKFHEHVGAGSPAGINTPADWKAAARVEDGKWLAELYIPYSTIGAVLKEGTVVRANLCRNNAALNESTCWAKVKGGFHQPLRFGNLVMGIPLYRARFGVDTAEPLQTGTIRLRTSAENPSKSDLKLVATLFPGGRPIKTTKPVILPAGKTVAADLVTAVETPGTINLRLAAVDAKTGAPVSEMSFAADVRPAPPAAIGGVITAQPWGTLWQSISTFKVMRDTKPPSRKIAAVRITAARNEYEAFQLVLRPTKTLSGVKVTPRSLIGPKKAKIDAYNVTVRNVEYLNVTQPTSADIEPGMYPDPLPEFTPVNAPAGQNTPIWISVYVPAKTAPGDYSGTIDVTAPGVKVSVPIKLHVWNFELPSVSALRTAYGCDMEAVCRYQGATTLEQKRKLLHHYNMDFFRHRIAPYSPYTYYDIRGTVENDVIKLDFSDFDVAIQKYFALFNGYNLPHFGMGDTAGMNFGDNYDQLKIEYMRMVTEHLAEKGQIHKGYNYITDEPPPEQYPKVVAAAELCRMADQRIKVLLTNCVEHVNDALIGSVDIWVPVLSVYDEARAKERQKAGEEVWWYVCCGPHHPYPNNFIDYPALDHRVLHWITWRYGVNGILYWSATYWPENPWHTPISRTPDGKGSFGNGDGRLIYPPVREPSDTFVDKGPVPSIRWEIIRDGVEDYDYFAILKAKLANSRPGPAANKARAALARVNELAASRTDYTRDPAKLESAREQVARAIEALK